MTFSMLFRAVARTVVVPPFVTSVPPFNELIADPKSANAGFSVFTCEMFITTIMVLGMLVARENKNVIYVALPSAIALYFSNAVCTLIVSGFDHPVVAMIISI